MILLHFLSDFILQPNVIAENKSKDWRYMFLHMVIIYAVFGPFAYWVGASQWLVALYVCLHGLQDTYVWGAFKKYAHNRLNREDYIKYNLHVKDGWFWITIAIDQSIHICLLIFLFTSYF